MATYLEYRTEDGLVTNAIAYDGEAPYDPGEGHAITPLPDEPHGVWIGWTRNEDGTFTPPVTDE